MHFAELGQVAGFFLPFSYKKKQQILKIYQQAFLNNDLLDDSKLRTALSFNGTPLPYLDIENKNFLNLMNQGTILEKTLYWFSNLCCCTGNNSDVDVNLTHINDNGKIM